jgi:hypothetical protein
VNRYLIRAFSVAVLGGLLLVLPSLCREGAVRAEPPPPQRMRLSYPSPDGSLTAVIVPLGDATVYTDDLYECHLQIRRVRKVNKRRGSTHQQGDPPGRLLWSHDFTSPDHGHGRGVAFARWSPNSRFFVFSTVSSGGHHPWEYFTYVFDRRSQQMYFLNGDRAFGAIIRPEFQFSGEDTLTVTSLDWKKHLASPDADDPSKTVRASLGHIVTALRPED